MQGNALDRGVVAARLQEICRDADAGQADGDAEVLALAADVERSGLEGDEAHLDVRARTAVRLLERGRPQVARDVVRHGLDGQPFLTHLRQGRVYVWLPGFGDPRAGVPDEVYDMTDRVVLRRGLEEVRWQGRTLVLGGFAHLSHLVAEPDDEVSLVLQRLGSDVRVRVRAERRRRPDRVGSSGQALTRLAWSGFRAEVRPHALGGPSTWRLVAEVSQAGVTRTERLSPSRGGEVAQLKPFDLAGPRWAAGIAVTRRGELGVEPRQVLPPAPVRSARRLLRRAV